DVEMVRLDLRPILSLVDPDPACAGNELRQGALVGRIEVLDQDEGHAGVGGQLPEEQATRLETAGRGADPDDGEARLAEARSFRGGVGGRHRGYRGSCAWFLSGSCVRSLTPTCRAFLAHRPYSNKKLLHDFTRLSEGHEVTRHHSSPARIATLIGTGKASYRSDRTYDSRRLSPVN